MDLILHCGHGKTGSTSIQAALHDARHRLLGQAVIYHAPANGGHFNFSYLVGNKHRIGEHLHAERLARAKAVCTQIRDRATRKGASFVLLSSEGFFQLRQSEMDLIIQALGLRFDRIYSIIYIRNPVDRYLPAVQQALKGSHRLLDPCKYERHVVKSLEYWRDYVGRDRLHLGVFDKTRLAEGDVVTDFANKLSEITGTTIELNSTRHLNPSIHAEQMVVLQEFREEFLSEFDGQFCKPSGRLLRFFNDLTDNCGLPGTKPVLADSVAKIIWENHRRDVALVDKLFEGSGYYELCNPRIADGGADKLTSWRNVTQVLEDFNDDLCRLLKSCIPNFNPQLRVGLDNSICQNPAIENSGAFFEAVAAYLEAEGCESASTTARALSGQ